MVVLVVLKSRERSKRYTACFDLNIYMNLKNIINGEKGKQKFKGKVHNWPTSSSVQSNISSSVPDKPRITQVANKTDTMLQFEWEHPNPNGRLEGYKVRLFSIS